MTLEEIIKSIPKPNWLDCVDSLSNSRPYELTKDERNVVCSQLEKWFKEGNAKHATNWLMIGLMFGRMNFIDHIRRTGLLRPSKYDYATRTIRSALSRVLASRLEKDESVVKYFISIKNLREWKWWKWEML